MLDSIRCALRNLGRKKMRSALTIAGIAIGVASVILISSISECGTAAVNNEMDSLGLGGLTISLNSTSGASTANRLTEEELDAVRDTQHVKQAMPLMMQNTKVSNKSNAQLDALVWGIDSKANQVISLQVLYGRMISSVDVNSYSNVCMVDQTFAQNVYHRDNIVGKKISILCGSVEEEFEVVGVIKTGSGLLQNFIGDYIPNFLYMPYTTLQNATGRQSFDQIAVRVEDNFDVDEAGNAIVSTLARSTGINDGFVANNLVKQKDGLKSILNTVTVILSAVGAISLLVASLSIMTVMLVSVNERTREIGIKKSIGARRSTIMFEFLMEAVLISLVGCLVGVIAGVGISFIGASYVNMTLQLRGDIMLLSVGFSLLSGIIFGVYPAAKASSLRPVDALRTE